VEDIYTRQRINTVYKDLCSLRKTSLNFYGDHKLRLNGNVLYIKVCMIRRKKDGSMTAHFLRHSAVANNLPPKLTESETVEIIHGHYPAYVQRTMLSAVWTICDALNLLNRLEFLEGDGKRKPNSGSSAQIRTNPSDVNAKPSQDKLRDQNRFSEREKYEVPSYTQL
jgi:hypothetical protein